MDYSPAPAYYPLNSENHAAWIVATSLIFLIYSIMAMIAKLILRMNINTLKSPDICLMACLALLLVQTALIVSACNRGLGRHTETLTQAAFTSYSRFYYASTLLSIMIQAGTKISICLWINAISPQYRLLLVNRALMAIIAVWAISGVFATAFQCDLPSPWPSLENDDCVSMHAIYVYNGTMNVLTDLIICVLPIVMMWKVQTSRNKKIQVCALFGTRVLVPAITIPALATSSSYFDHVHTDPTWYAVIPTILAQISLNMSLLTACIPGLKSVLDNLLSGTANARIKGAYDLTNSGDKKTRLTVTPWGTAMGTKYSGSGTNSRSKKKSSFSADRSVGATSSHRFSITGGFRDAMMSGAQRHGSTDTSENTRLHEGVIFRTDDYDISSIRNISRPPTQELASDPVELAK